jgi:polyribonucleotide nucleotidyltransferase
MTIIKTIISSVASFGGSVASFISSARSTYILIGIISIGGVYLWNDYQSLRADNGKLSLALEVAGKGTKDAVNIAEHNAQQAIEMKNHYEEILRELQRVGSLNRALQESLSEQEATFDKFRKEASEEFNRCMDIQLPQDLFGELVKPSDGVSSPSN